MGTVVITGANKGIGLKLAEYYAIQHTVYALCRHSSDELEQLGVNIISDFDLAQPKEQLSKKVQPIENVSLLINNAGQWGDEQLGDIDYDKMRQNFEINALGPLKVTEALLPSMQAGAKVVFVSSRMGSIEDNTTGGRYAYRMSKAALNAGGRSVAVDLRPKDIAVGIIHPGWVRTNMGGSRGLIDVGESVAGITRLIEQLTLENSGNFWHVNGYQLPW